MKRTLYLIIFFLFAFFTDGLCSPVGLDSLLSELDRHLLDSKYFTQQKDDHITEMKRNISAAKTQEELFDIYSELFDEYKSYKYDSAYVYANRALKVAEVLEDKDKIVSATCDIAFCLASSGLFMEAHDAVSELDAGECSASAKISYYSLCARLFYDLADYNHEAPFNSDYIARGSMYTDSLLLYLDKNSPDWWYAVGQKQMKENDFGASFDSFKHVLDLGQSDTHTQAIVLSCMGWICFLQNDGDSALEYLIRSAVNDIRSATKETTALRMVANLLYERGDINRSYRYVRSALEDAEFYNARLRKIEVGQILPLIEQERFDMMRRQRNMLIAGGTGLFALILALCLTVAIINRQNRKLTSARATIEERNTQLEAINGRLSEANQIKDEYIGSSFYTNSEYLNRMEEIYNTVNRGIEARQWDMLRSAFKLSRLNAERENMYASFDETFLKLFPHFIEGYNELFPPEEQVRPKSDKSLTPELRIFALIRLGITKPERIAKFLNFSVHTVNTYKTRVKNKSLIPNEEFEKRIMTLR